VRGVRRHLTELLALLAIAAVSVPVAAYILDHQRLRFPWQHVITIQAEFQNAQAVSPGQGQTVTIAGVKIGEIAKVEVEDGVALVTTEIDPDESGPIYDDATMFLRPKTGLNDMTIQLDPGTPGEGRRQLEDGDRIPVASTSQYVNPDEVLANLDADTRRYVALMANSGGQGLRGRGPDLRRLLKASEPTFESTRRVNRAIADRRAKLRRLVHNLRVLAGATASKDDQLASLVDASSSVLQTIAAREGRLSATIGRLPGALGATRRALVGAHALADELTPAARDLGPLARELEPALRQLRPLLADAGPILRDDLRPLVREATPLVADLRPAVDDLGESTPPLVRTGKVLNQLANELGHNPPGGEEGFLFWTSWFLHNANSILSVEDAHGVTWRGLVMVSCSTFPLAIAANPALAPLAAVPVCPPQPGGTP
jgi:phospholipid/cholesterol/gamma-HCH transport system substrate-binding protein